MILVGHDVTCGIKNQLRGHGPPPLHPPQEEAKLLALTFMEGGQPPATVAPQPKATCRRRKEALGGGMGQDGPGGRSSACFPMVGAQQKPVWYSG